MQMDKADEAETLRYAQANFWTERQLADAVGVEEDALRSFVRSRCCPAASYVRSARGWWSALQRRGLERPVGDAWFSRGAAWTTRRAVLMRRSGKSLVDVADTLRREFISGFSDELLKTDQAALAFADCFENGHVDLSNAQRRADVEWNAWLDGGYGNCLRVFTPQTCIRKEALSTSMKAALRSRPYDPATLLDLAEQLSAVMLPFAPWQRPTCTPGQTIDILLSEHRLGTEDALRLRLGPFPG